VVRLLYLKLVSDQASARDLRDAWVLQPGFQVQRGYLQQGLQQSEWEDRGAKKQRTPLGFVLRRPKGLGKGSKVRTARFILTLLIMGSSFLNGIGAADIESDVELIFD
jgi:hypothetical protein